MAQVVEYRASLSVGDSRNKLADISWRITSAMFTAYQGAADQATRLATGVGTMMAGVEGLTRANVFERGVHKIIVEDTAAYPSDSAAVFHFDKITVAYKAGIDSYSMTIPSRDTDVVSTGMLDGVINIEAGVRTAEVDAYITSLANGMIAKNGGQPIVQKMYINR